MSGPAAGLAALVVVLLATPAARAQETPASSPADAQTTGPVDENAGIDPDSRHRYRRILPIGAQKAIERGFKLPLPFGVSAMVVDSHQLMTGSNLSVALARDKAPPADATLIPIPFVTTDRLDGHNTTVQARADAWLFPWIDLYAAVGKASGKVDVGVDIHLDEVLPPPVCRVHSCPDEHLNFKATVENATFTVGALMIYGGKGWFVSATAAKTIAVATDKDRSDIESLDAAIRAGPRVPLGGKWELQPYVGVNYFDIDTDLTGSIVAEGIYPGGGDLGLRYRLNMENVYKWSGILGFNLSVGGRWFLQAEYDKSKEGHRTIGSVIFRF